MLNECLHLLGDGAFLREDKELTYEERKNKKTKSSCERKFKVGNFVTVVNPKSLNIGRTFEIIDYDDFDEFYILENAVGFKGDDLELYIGQSMAEKRFSVGNFIAIANNRLENYNKVLKIDGINGNDIKLSDGSVVFWTDIELFQRDELELKKASGNQIGGNHYSKLAIQPFEYSLKNNLNMGQASVIKYITRYKDKNGKEDLLKAKHFIDLLLEYEYGND